MAVSIRASLWPMTSRARSCGSAVSIRFPPCARTDQWTTSATLASCERDVPAAQGSLLTRPGSTCWRRGDSAGADTANVHKAEAPYLDLDDANAKLATVANDGVRRFPSRDDLRTTTDQRAEEAPTVSESP